MKEKIRGTLRESGAVSIGFAKAGKIDEEDIIRYSKWIESGNQGGMDYLSRNMVLRQHTDNVLPGARTVISLAFNYAPESWRELSKPAIAVYAYGEDYHDVVRKRLRGIMAKLKDEYGGEWRICVDSAPIAERYWALKSGIGKLTKSGNVWIAGGGTMCFLVEILTTVQIEPDIPSGCDVEICGDCHACIVNCPGKTLKGDSTLDSAKCVSYLTIEKRGDFTPQEIKSLDSQIYKNGFLFGCDLCVRLCKLNKNLQPTAIKEFTPRQEILGMEREDVVEMEDNEFSRVFSKSPIKRAKREGLKRNARYCP